ncbi:MAG: DUF2791 family P-loop domain-containing protein, partial [Gemmatimonadetes bacterium]|nr:DUF2791 family P-loop domain-containing protein [Gemmatimonadota bacterium]
MDIKVRLLGQPCIAAPPDADLPLGKPLAMLVYLIDQGPSTRDHLAELLWPGSDRSKGRASVRQALWLLRQRLGDDVFTMDEPVALNGDRVSTDLDDLIRELDSPKMDPRRLDPLLGEPLAGLTVSDAPAWRHWAEDFRSRTAYRIASRLGAQSEVRAVQGDPAAACDCLRLALRIQPERVETHLALISHLLDLRAFDEAEEQIDTVRRIGDPDAARLVVPWEDRLRALRMSQVPAGKPEIHLDFVGRSRETSALTAKLRSAAAGQGQVAVVTGPAGIGKTRLIEELALVAQIDGVRVVRAKAHDAERKIRFGVMADLIRELLQLPGSAGISAASDEVLRGFLPSLHSRGKGNGARADNGTGNGRETPAAVPLGDAFLDLVDAVSGETPVLVILDDLHWADEDTRSLVSRVGRRMGNTSALLMVTSRRSADPQLQRTLEGLATPTHAARFELGPLQRADTEELLGLLAEFG